MADFNIRSDSVDVEQIMAQIRARIQEKRGVDYTEEQVRELATVRLEKFLDPKNLRSDLLEQFKRTRPGLPEPPKEPPPVEPPYVFDDETLFRSHRGPLRLIRQLLKPLLKLFFNPNTLNQVLHAQAQFNVDLLKRDQRRKIELQNAVYAFDRSRAEWNVLYYEVLHNLVLETTRNGIELKNLKMRVEALASRLDFSERRVRALEGVVQYRPEIVRPRPANSREGQNRPRDEGGGADAEHLPARPEPAGTATAEDGAVNAGESGGRRRRRRRRGRRGTGIVPGALGGPAAASTIDPEPADEDFDMGEDDEALGEVHPSPGDDASLGDVEEPAGHAGSGPPMAAEHDRATEAKNADGAASGEGEEPNTRSTDPHGQ
jgi:hypothetical protein